MSLKPDTTSQGSSHSLVLQKSSQANLAFWPLLYSYFFTVLLHFVLLTLHMHISNDLLRSNLVKVVRIGRLAQESKNNKVKIGSQVSHFMSQFISVTVIIAPIKAKALWYIWHHNYCIKASCNFFFGAINPEIRNEESYKIIVLAETGKFWLPPTFLKSWQRPQSTRSF